MLFKCVCMRLCVDVCQSICVCVRSCVCKFVVIFKQILEKVERMYEIYYISSLSVGWDTHNLNLEQYKSLQHLISVYCGVFKCRCVYVRVCVDVCKGICVCVRGCVCKFIIIFSQMLKKIERMYKLYYIM